MHFSETCINRASSAGIPAKAAGALPTDWQCSNMVSSGFVRTDCNRSCLVAHAGAADVEILTGGGDDGFWGRGVAAAVRVHLGSGNDMLAWERTGATAELDVGAGRDMVKTNMP